MAPPIKPHQLAKTDFELVALDQKTETGDGVSLRVLVKISRPKESLLEVARDARWWVVAFL
jgi:hypothetical protein